MELSEQDGELINSCKVDFKEFIKYIFPQSFNKYTEQSHLYNWADRIQNNKKTATVSARKHLKSTLMYAYIMWRIFKMGNDESWLYMSYTEPLSRYHTTNIKKYIRNNPFF